MNTVITNQNAFITNSFFTTVTTSAATFYAILPFFRRTLPQISTLHATFKPVSVDWHQLSSGLSPSLIDFNLRAAALSQNIGRSVLSPKELASFIHPDIPMEKLFELSKPLGAGANRSVWAVQASSGTLAMKVSDLTLPLSSPNQETERWINSVKKEFEIGLSLTHPNIMTTHHFALKREQDVLRAYSLCEYVPGSTLGKQFTNYSIAPKYRQQLIDQARRIEHEISQFNIAAFDLHKENILVTPEGNLKLIDLEMWRPQASPLHMHIAQFDWTYLIQALKSLPNPTC